VPLACSHKPLCCSVHDSQAGDLTDRVLDHGGGFKAKLPCLRGPSVVEGLGIGGVGLGWAAVGGGFAFQPPPLPRCRLTAHRFDEPVRLVVDPAGHRRGTGRELGQHCLGDIRNLRDPVFVELRGEGFDDAKQVEDLEVVRRWLAIGTTFSTELTIQVLEERRGSSNGPPLSRH